MTVSDVARVLQGKGVDKKKCNEDGKGFPVILGASSLSSGGIEVTRWIESPSPAAVFSKFGDILISAQGTCGKIAINNKGDAVITDAIIAVRPIPPLCDPYFLLVVIVEAVELGHIIPEFDENTVGFSRTIKSDLIGGIEFMPLDTLHQIETVEAMKNFVTTFMELQPEPPFADKEGRQKNAEKIPEESESLEDCIKKMKSHVNRQKKSLQNLEKFARSINEKKTAEAVQEELF